MKQPAILAQAGPRPTPDRAAHGYALVFNTCGVGGVLRAVALVQAVTAVTSMFVATQPLEWLLNWAVITAAALPATLAWLVAGCTLRRLWVALPIAWQWMAGVLLGAVAGLFGCLIHVWTGLSSANPPLFAGAAAGALTAAVLLADTAWRLRARLPALEAARLAELQARIRPHFLFNALNSAIALVRDEPARAEAVLENLSDLFRHALAHADSSAPLAQELELARQYLDIEQVRFGERLRVQWDLDARANTALMPVLALQPLVENAVAHGVEPSSEGGKILIRTSTRSNRAIIDIINTLAGSSSAGSGFRRVHHGIAMDNVNQRLHLLHDMDCSFSAHPTGSRYFQVRITVPLN